MTSFGDDEMTKLVDIARDTWEQVIAARGADAEWLPTLMLYDDDDSVFVASVGSLLDGEVSTRDLAVAAASELVRPTTAWLAVTLDSYIAHDKATMFLVSAGVTTLRQEYGRGNPHVLDCLFVYAMNRAGTATLRTMPYRRAGRYVEWLDDSDMPDFDSGELAGTVPDLLRAVMTRAGN